MASEGKIIAVIPARGGSKGVPRKNIRPLGAKPLIAWTIEEAKKSRFIDRLVLSSEDEEIIEVAKKFGCEVPYKRPEELAKDDTPGIDPVIDIIKKLPGYEYVVLLQPTSPLRSVIDIDGCIESCLEKKANAMVSVEVVKKHPCWMYSINGLNKLIPFMQQEKMSARRQDFSPVTVLNGAIFMAKCGWLLKNKAFVTDETYAYLMPEDRSIDIDSNFDFLLAELLIKETPQHL